MRPHFITRLTAAVAACFGLASSASALLIDDFTTAQSHSVTLLGAESGNSASGGGILGGERDGYLLLQAGTSIAFNVNSGAASYNEAVASDGRLFFTWDGADDSSVINQVGLGGIDLTEGGTQNAFTVQILLNTLPATNLNFLVHTSAGDYSTATFSAPIGASTLTILFADFVPLAGTGADFTDIGAVSFYSDPAVPGQSMQFGTIQTAAVPEPASGALLALGLLGLALRRR